MTSGFRRIADRLEQLHHGFAETDLTKSFWIRGAERTGVCHCTALIVIAFTNSDRLAEALQRLGYKLEARTSLCNAKPHLMSGSSTQLLKLPITGFQRRCCPARILIYGADISGSHERNYA